MVENHLRATAPDLEAAKAAAGAAHPIGTMGEPDEHRMGGGLAGLGRGQVCHRHRDRHRRRLYRAMMDLTEPHAIPVADCLADLAATPDGLTAPEAARRLAEHGPNRLPEVAGAGAAGPFPAAIPQCADLCADRCCGCDGGLAALGRYRGDSLPWCWRTPSSASSRRARPKPRWRRSGACWHQRPPCCAMGDGYRWTGPTLCPATSCCWRLATRCPPTCG